MKLFHAENNLHRYCSFYASNGLPAAVTALFGRSLRIRLKNYDSGLDRRYRLNIDGRWIMESIRRMVVSMQSSFSFLRIPVAAVWILLCVLIIGAPILASRAEYGPALWIYLVFSNVCHQIPDRSFIIAGFPLAICHRCAGIYLGFILGSLIRNPIPQRSPAVRRSWILVLTLPLIIDATLPLTGIWAGSAPSRFLTGLLFGTMLSSLLLQGIMEFMANSRRRRHIEGGVR